MYVKQDPYICVFFLFVFTTAGNAAEQVLRSYTVDVGRNLSLPCPVQKNSDVMWEHKGENGGKPKHHNIQEDGSLFLMDIEAEDAGIYACTPQNVVGEDQTALMEVEVKTPPPPLINVHVVTSTILGIILWSVNGTGGHPIIYFTAQFRLADSNATWEDITPVHIPHNVRQVDVYKLKPNTTYAFRVWAVNKLGESEMTTAYSTTTISDEAAQLERHFLRGIKDFDTRVWIIAVGIVMGTLVVLGFGTCFLLYQECRMPGESEDQEVIELVPNIILNPGFEGNLPRTDRVPADENSNSETTTRLNNNTVVQPRNNL